jgi:hypothetical protein
MLAHKKKKSSKKTVFVFKQIFLYNDCNSYTTALSKITNPR